jgi:hypothetical protein
VKRQPIYITSHNIEDNPLALIQHYDQGLVDLLTARCQDQTLTLSVEPTYLNENGEIKILGFAIVPSKHGNSGDVSK